MWHGAADRIARVIGYDEINIRAILREGIVARKSQLLTRLPPTVLRRYHFGMKE